MSSEIHRMRTLVQGMQATDNEVIAFATSIAHYMSTMDGCEHLRLRTVEEAATALPHLIDQLAERELCASMGHKGWAIIRPIQVDIP